MTLVKCDITEGPRDGYKTIGVTSAEGRTEYMDIEVRFLADLDGEQRLAIRVIGRDKKQKLYLIQFPVEADSGANRVWVRDVDIAPIPDEIPA